MDDATQREAVGSWWQESREAVGSWPGERRGEQLKLAWKNGGAVNTRHENRETRRQDRVQ